MRRSKRSPARETSGERLLLFLGDSLVDAFRPIRQATYRPSCQLNRRSATEPIAEAPPTIALNLFDSFRRQCIALNIAADDRKGGIVLHPKALESAAAAVLDINKTIVHARNQRGKVVARQLMAISESDRLVCFDIDPSSVAKEIKQAFVDFDKAFASNLGLPLHREQSEESPEISNPVSHNWWDDMD